MDVGESYYLPKQNFESPHKIKRKTKKTTLSKEAEVTTKW